MARRMVIAGLVLAQLLLVLLVGAIAVSTFGPGATPSVLLTLFTGTATVQRAGSTAAASAHTGQSVGAGDTVQTGAASKAALSYADGSVTRLDSATTVVVRSQGTGAAVNTSVTQSAGLTWNVVKRLAGSSSFKVNGPNSAAAEVRGTRFGYYVEHDPAGNPVIWIDVWDGTVRVTGATGPAVTATGGQRVTVRAQAAPTAPLPIPASDRQLEFTVFNQTLEAVRGTPIAFANGDSSPGDVSGPFSVTADGRSDLQFVLGWPGSTYELTILDPSGRVFSQGSSASPPHTVTASRARAGTWTYRVRDVQSGPLEAWWLVVGRG